MHLHTRLLRIAAFGLMAVTWSLPVSAADADLDARIQAAVARALADRQVEVEELSQRLQSLERLTREQEATIERLQGQAAATPPSTAVEPQQEITAEQTSAEQEQLVEGLAISGFFDVVGRSDNSSENTFELGAVEVDLEYADEHFAVGAALVWDGDDAEVGVAFLDYHSFDDRVPARGRIFQEPGYHLQVGRFDLPFGNDYQYYAAPDRPNISAPLTTDRILDGGLNGDGVRVYGTHDFIDYAAYWTNALYADQGTAVGGRLGLALSRDPFRFHHMTKSHTLEFGVSYLADMDGDYDLRDQVWALDATIAYGMVQLSTEVSYRDSREDVIDGNDVNLGERDEWGYHLSILADLEGITGRPITLFGRYEKWLPDYARILDADDDTVSYRVEDIPRLTLGLNYTIYEHLQLRLEYLDSLGHDTDEPDFDDRLGAVQAVASF